MLDAVEAPAGGFLADPDHLRAIEQVELPGALSGLDYEGARSVLADGQPILGNVALGRSPIAPLFKKVGRAHRVTLITQRAGPVRMHGSRPRRRRLFKKRRGCWAWAEPGSAAPEKLLTGTPAVTIRRCACSASASSCAIRQTLSTF
jgi:hypothetical protein